MSELRGEFDRRAPYAPISALRDFFERIRDIGVPQRVDKRFLQRINVASSNEWALLSALKFLGIVDEHGLPTHAYRLLQSTGQYQETLRHLVETAYAPVFEVGGGDMDLDDLRNYFRVESSPSQAKNAARFFREVCEMAGMPAGGGRIVPGRSPTGGHRAPPEAGVPLASPVVPSPAAESASPILGSHTDQELLLSTKARLLEKLPAPRPEWSANDYRDICDRFLAMLKNLDS